MPNWRNSKERPIPYQQNLITRKAASGITELLESVPRLVLKEKGLTS